MRGGIFLKKAAMKEMMKQYEIKPTSKRTITLNGTDYTVISHYTGNKDVGAVINELALKKAYAEMLCEA